MTIEVHAGSDSKVLELRIEDRLTRRDYESFVPDIEQQIRLHGRIRLLVDITAFGGVDLGAVWEDVKFDIKHFNDIERLAVVGDKRWHQWMTRFSRPFTTAQVRYFPRADEARAWLAA